MKFKAWLKKLSLKLLRLFLRKQRRIENGIKYFI